MRSQKYKMFDPIYPKLEIEIPTDTFSQAEKDFQSRSIQTDFVKDIALGTVAFRPMKVRFKLSDITKQCGFYTHSIL